MRTEELEEARDYLERAVARVLREDCHLLLVDVSERCIAARLAMYLNEYFVDCDVDVEYNRDSAAVKRLHGMIESCTRDRDGENQARAVLPDVVVHRRGCNDSNLLVIEMKKKNRRANQTDMECARQRIRAFRAQLHYKMGALVVCEVGSRPDIYVAPPYEE